MQNATIKTNSLTHKTTINKNQLFVSIRSKRIDIIRNGSWIGKTSWTGNFEFKQTLPPDEYKYVEKFVSSHFKS